MTPPPTRRNDDFLVTGFRYQKPSALPPHPIAARTMTAPTPRVPEALISTSRHLIVRR